MNEAKTEYTKYDDWKAAGLARGMEGPFTVSGHLTLWQFVDDKGTAGMWNALSTSGFLFDPSPNYFGPGPVPIPFGKSTPVDGAEHGK